MHYSSPSPLGGLTRLSCDGRVVTRHKPRSQPLQNRRACNESIKCDVPGCGYHRHKFSRLCRKHYRKLESTGHHTAGSIRRGTWRPWVTNSAAFVSQQLRLGHPGIAAGVQWCATELLSPPLTRARHDSSGQRPHVSYSLALAKMRRGGVGPDDMLVRWIAAYALRQWDVDHETRPHRRVFQSDEHFIHQTAKLFLHTIPLGAPKWAKGSPEEDDSPTDKGATKATVTVRRFTFHRVNSALGLLALRSADEINKRLANGMSSSGALNPVSRVSDDTAPFL